jgi:hypothetical protein
MSKLKEDLQSSVPLNNVGSGGIEGIGVGPRGEPGVPRKGKKLRVLFPMLKRKTLRDISKEM